METMQSHEHFTGRRTEGKLR